MKTIRTKDITDEMVCRAYQRAEVQRGNGRAWRDYDYPYTTLERETGACFKVCYRAMERAANRGLVEYGVSLRTGWLTDEGKALLQSAT